MIKSVKITNYLNESIELELRYPEKSGFLIRDIQGVGAGKADINTSDLANDDGSIFNSSRILSRNIVFFLDFLDAPSVESVRQKAYKYFPLKKKVKLLFTTDTRFCEIEGYVETNDPIIFSKKEHTQISIVCPNPYFYDAEEQLTVFYGVEPLFEFPMENPSLNQKLLEFGNIQNKTTNTVYYEGDAEIGVTIEIRAVGTAENITIYNLLTRETMAIDSDKLLALTGSGIVAGDEIHISTVKGNKSITLFRDGEYVNILNCLGRQVNWFQLTKGDNLFAYTAEYGITNLQFKIRNRLVYEGI